MQHQPQPAGADYVNSPPLTGMPTTANVPGMGELPFGPTPAIRQAAQNYMNEQGLPYNPPRSYAPVDPEQAAKVASEFEKMKHDPTNPEVASAYSDLIDQTKKQFAAIQKTGLKIDFVKPGMDDPYAASPRLAQTDVVNNNHLWVFPTEGGFGPEGAKYEADHPMLKDSGVTLDGKQLKNNDLFRIVHDVFGHIKEGVGFRATGEDNAFRQHRAMFTENAQRALTTETRGQNSQLNFGNPVNSPADVVYETMNLDLRVLEVDPIHRRIVLAVTGIPEEQPPRPETPSKVIPMETDDYNLSDPIPVVPEAFVEE